LDFFGQCFRQGDDQCASPSLGAPLAEMDRAIGAIRTSRILAKHELEAPLQMLDLANRYHATASSLEECGQLLQSLDTPKLSGDYAL